VGLIWLSAPGPPHGPIQGSGVTAVVQTPYPGECMKWQENDREACS
jgi:hypothetical protein